MRQMLIESSGDGQTILYGHHHRVIVIDELEHTVAFDEVLHSGLFSMREERPVALQPSMATEPVFTCSTHRITLEFETSHPPMPVDRCPVKHAHSASESVLLAPDLVARVEALGAGSLADVIARVLGDAMDLATRPPSAAPVLVEVSLPPEVSRWLAQQGPPSATVSRLLQKAVEVTEAAIAAAPPAVAGPSRSLQLEDGTIWPDPRALDGDGSDHVLNSGLWEDQQYVDAVLSAYSQLATNPAGDVAAVHTARIAR